MQNNKAKRGCEGCLRKPKTQAETGVNKCHPELVSGSQIKKIEDAETSSARQRGDKVRDYEDCRS